MKIYAHDNGDRDVGINPSETEIEVNLDLSQFDEQEREQIRDGFKQFVIDFLYFDSDTEVQFEDECPDCFAFIVDGKCSFKDCISNYGG